MRTRFKVILLQPPGYRIGRHGPTMRQHYAIQGFDMTLCGREVTGNWEERHGPSNVCQRCRQHAMANGYRYEG